MCFTYQKRVMAEGEESYTLYEREHCVSPYALIWSNDHYYLVANNDKYDNLMHTRIDRMKKVEIIDLPARDFSEVSPYKHFFDSADYSGKIFNMFSGDTQRLELCCHNSIIEEILDRFGSEVTLKKANREGHFTLSTKCVVSEGLVSWIMQFGPKIEVLSPKKLREDVRDRADEIIRLYRF